MKSVLVEGREPGSAVWTRVGPLIMPGDQRGSGTAFWDAELMTVVFGFDDHGVPRVWLDDRVSEDVIDRQRMHAVPVQQLLPLADLRNGPFEMPGPVGHWRWSLVDD